MLDLAKDLELPLVGVLARMEHAGILVDRDVPRGAERRPRRARCTRSRAQDPRARRGGVQRRIRRRSCRRSSSRSSTSRRRRRSRPAGRPIRPSSRRSATRTRSSRSSSTYREVAKLKTGFTDALLPLIDPKTGRIHTTYLQASASTGRLASTNPNMQNIPIRGELGRQIRRAFIAPEGHVAHLGGLLADRAARARAPRRRTRGSSRRSRPSTTSTRRSRRRSTASTSRTCSRSMRDYAKQFSLRHRVRDVRVRRVAASGHRRRKRRKTFIDAYYAQFPKVQDFLDEQVEAGAASTASRRRCSAAAATCPSSSRRTTGCGRWGSGWR